MFVDEARIFVKAGDGGHGCCSFRREKYVPRGGPNGGDGGHGGSIILKADPQLHTLIDLTYQQQYRAQRGAHGEGKNCSGRGGEDRLIAVPVGTMVYDAESGELLADLSASGQTLVAAKGGRGGRGNARFATPTHRAPRRADPGEPGEERTLRLELKLLADVGIVGFPNAGKSTLLSAISKARPKIADYPFTTLTPQLGVARDAAGRNFIVADIPGLIEGAHAGKGLGHQFLRHVERTRVMLHLVDAGVGRAGDPVKEFRILRKELTAYQPGLAEKPMVLAANKIDAQGDGGHVAALRRYAKKEKIPFFAVSAVTGEGLTPLLTFLGDRAFDADAGTRSAVSVGAATA
ncbi:MAG TPA: GTPase ObgE [Nitrospiria bacterium]|nr:GTPase ObgE [Nitrospiria bacterium]